MAAPTAELFVCAVPGRGLMFGAVKKDRDFDLQMRIAYTCGVTMQEVLVMTMPAVGMYEMNHFTEAFGFELPKLVSANPEQWSDDLPDVSDDVYHMSSGPWLQQYVDDVSKEPK